MGRRVKRTGLCQYQDSAVWSSKGADRAGVHGIQAQEVNIVSFTGMSRQFLAYFISFEFGIILLHCQQRGAENFRDIRSFGVATDEKKSRSRALYRNCPAFFRVLTVKRPVLGVLECDDTIIKYSGHGGSLQTICASGNLHGDNSV